MNFYARLSLLQTFVMYLCRCIKFNLEDHCLCRTRFVYDVSYFLRTKVVVLSVPEPCYLHWFFLVSSCS